MMGSETMWGRVFTKWRRKGVDLSDAAFRADEAMKRYAQAQDRRGYEPHGTEVAAPRKDVDRTPPGELT